MNAEELERLNAAKLQQVLEEAEYQQAVDDAIARSREHYRRSEELLGILAVEKDHLDSQNALVLVLGALTEVLQGQLLMKLPPQ